MWQNGCVGTNTQEMKGSGENKQENFPGRDEMVAQAKKGDLAAFEQLVRQEQDGIRAFLAVRMARTDEAEDLAQETFIVAYRELGQFDSGRPLRPWLIGIAHNLLRNHLRKFRPEPIGGNEELQKMFDGYLSLQRGDGHAAEVFVYLDECLAKLEGKAREVIEARYLKGETIREMRKKSGKGHSALTMYLHRIRETLGSCIEGKMKHAGEGN